MLHGQISIDYKLISYNIFVKDKRWVRLNSLVFGTCRTHMKGTAISCTVGGRITKLCLYWIASHHVSYRPDGCAEACIRRMSRFKRCRWKQRIVLLDFIRCASLCVNFNCIVYTAVRSQFSRPIQHFKTVQI